MGCAFLTQMTFYTYFVDFPDSLLATSVGPTQGSVHQVRKSSPERLGVPPLVTHPAPAETNRNECYQTWHLPTALLPSFLNSSRVSPESEMGPSGARESGALSHCWDGTWSSLPPRGLGE